MVCKLNKINPCSCRIQICHKIITIVSSNIKVILNITVMTHYSPVPNNNYSLKYKVVIHPIILLSKELYFTTFSGNTKTYFFKV